MHPMIYWVVRWMRRRPYIAALIAIPLVIYMYHISFVIYYEHDNWWHDFRGVSMDKYKWPLELDTEQLMNDYRRGTLNIKPITLDNSSITLHPPSDTCNERTLVTVLIKVRVQDRPNRDLLRRTWIEDLKSNKLRYGFLLGQCSSEECQRSLNAELNDHQDLIQGNFIDAYHNNTLKFRIGLKYVIDHCNMTKYLLLIDGDYSLNVERLVSYLKDHKYPKNLYAGKLWPSSRPKRLLEEPQYMSYQFYPFRRLPPFIAAGASLMSAEILEPMHVVSRYTKYVKFDDVFYAMVARKLKIPLVDASDVLPSWFIPKLEEREKHRKIIGSHRFGNLTEVELIHHIIHGT